MKCKRNYLLIPLAVIAVSGVGSMFTSTGMERYKTLVLPQSTPAGSVIGMVWTFIYACCIASLLLIWNKTKHDHKFNAIIGLFLINGILNAAWSWLFFTHHRLGISFWAMVVIWILTMIKIILIWPRHRLASLLLWVYPLWVLIAGTFAWRIWMLN